MFPPTTARSTQRTGVVPGPSGGLVQLADRRRWFTSDSDGNTGDLGQATEGSHQTIGGPGQTIRGSVRTTARTDGPTTDLGWINAGTVQATKGRVLELLEIIVLIDESDESKVCLLSTEKTNTLDIERRTPYSASCQAYLTLRQGGKTHESNR